MRAWPNDVTFVATSTTVEIVGQEIGSTTRKVWRLIDTLGMVLVLILILTMISGSRTDAVLADGWAGARCEEKREREESSSEGLWNLHRHLSIQ
jgi:hypothetical protein